MGAGNGFGHGGQRFVDLTVILEAMTQNLDAQSFAFVPAGENGAGKGQGRFCNPVDLSIFLGGHPNGRDS